jgi:4'-phosphopantetheinyl transferase
LNDSASESATAAIQPLTAGEVRICTVDTGESASVRDVTRRIIASLLGIPHADVELFATPKGKPLLRNDPDLHFSIAHSHDVAMIAITRVAPVGVDVEQLRAVPNAEAILRRFFTHEEIGAILSDDNRDLRFVEAWTRSEARVKVRGASVWEAATPDPETTVRQIAAPDGFAAAVAVASATWWIAQHNTSVAEFAGN